MRRFLSAILSLSVFLLLQYGKIADYYFCKWQAEQQQQLKDCGCEIHLDAVFGDHQQEDGIAPPSFKDTVVDWVSIHLIPSPENISAFLRSSFVSKDENILEGVTKALFHPPASC